MGKKNLCGGGAETKKKKIFPKEKKINFLKKKGGTKTFWGGWGGTNPKQKKNGGWGTRDMSRN